MVRDEWVWCKCCERCYLQSQARRVVAPSSSKPLNLCAYPDCEGILLMETWPYLLLRQWIRPDWPEVPEPGEQYRLLG